jgi:peptidyl-dipeptidase Dcp
MTTSCKKQNAEPQNPFFEAFNTPYGNPPFDLIKTDDYKPAFIEGMKQQQDEIEHIANNSASPDFENTIVALDESGRLLQRVSSVFYAIKETDADTVLQRIATDISPLMSEHQDNIYMNKKLFARVKSVYDNRDAQKLDMEQKMLLEKYYRNFVMRGILLNDSQKSRLREINKDLDLLSLSFGENLLAETYNYQLVIDNEADLAGLPADLVELASEQAKEKGLEGKWLFNLSKPNWEPFLQYADNRALRETLYKAMYSRCANGNKNDNREILEKIVNLRLEKANLLGYKSYADFALENTMAHNPERVFGLLNRIWEFALPQAKRERDELQKMIDASGGGFKLQSWDWMYYAEKLRQKRYDLKEAELRPYFALEKVRNGAFEIAGKLYGISFKELHDVPVYQKDVKVFEVLDSDSSHLGLIYLDYFPRPGKSNGAWMGNFLEQSVVNGHDVRPVIYNVANFAMPTADAPSLLNLDQVETLFHEFGHALHGLLSKCRYEGVSGTNVYRDFVELPSQINEHWALNPESLKMFAKHYKTGETIPDSLIRKIQNAEHFNQGFMTTELVAAALLDMHWHVIETPVTEEVTEFENRVLDEIGLIPEIIVRYKSPYFSHIFDGGYSAGYYGYLWAETLDADAFEAFVEHGIFDPATARSFRDNILSRGGSDDPMRLYLRFRGSEPNPDFLLKNRGFIQ